MIELHNLKPDVPRRSRKRVGRGPGSGKGKTAGRGHKGQNSRSGGGVPAWFEGGQMPLQRRIPKRGFRKRNRVKWQVVNVGDLERVEGEVSPVSLRAAGLVRSLKHPVKLLGSGELAAPRACFVHGASGSAKQKIVDAGGEIATLDPAEYSDDESLEAAKRRMNALLRAAPRKREK